MADGVQAQGIGEAVDPEGILRSALEKIVFFECRVSQLESELAAARTTAERARADASEARRREVELTQVMAAERGAREDAQRRADDLTERIRLLEGERERLLGGLVERARVGGAPGADGAPGPEEGGADLAGFIAELRAEIEALRAWKAAAEAAGIRGPGGAIPVARGERGTETMPALAERFRAQGRVGLGGRDADRLKDLLTTRADRVLYERSMDDLKAADARVRIRAVRSLEALGARAAAPLLAAALGREQDEGVKAAILGALGRFQEPFAADLCTRALEDPRPAVRVAALEALARVAAGDSEARLVAALSDPSPLVRRRAALLLGFAAGDRAEAALSVALGDPDRGVARAAAAALSGRPTARAQGALARALEHPQETVRRAAAASLARVAGEAVSAEGSEATRRAASRRITARLAAMDGAALRDAVLAGAADAPAAERPSAAAAPVRRERPSISPPPSAGPAPQGQGRTQPGQGRTAQGERTREPAERVSVGSVRPERSSRTAAAESTGAPAVASPALPLGLTIAPAQALARAATAVMVQEPEPAPSPEASGLETAVLFEIRAALRGADPDHLSAAVGASSAAVAAALASLRDRGTLVQRGARWFMA